MNFTFLVFLFLTVNVTDESDVIGSHEPVKATVGQDVILPCHLGPPSDVSTLTVEWRQDEKQVHRYRSGKDYLALQDENFKDRTSLFHEEMSRGNISLKLTKVTERDAGNYTCFVPRLVKRGKVTLIVDHDQEKILTPADGRGFSRGAVVGIVFGILVIVGIGLFVWKKYRKTEQNAGDGGGRQEDEEDNKSEESDVIGSHEPVKATVGQDVILPCHLEPPFDVSTLTVEWKQDEKQVHRYRSGADDLVDQDKNYKDRTSLFHEEMTRGNISLKLTKVTERDAGTYTCHVPKLPSQVKRGKVTLTVESVDDADKRRQTNKTVHGGDEILTPADGRGLSRAVVVGTVILILFIVGIGLLVWKKYRKTEQNAGDGGGRQEDEEDDDQVNSSPNVQRRRRR
ncbi:CD276 antigen-like protein Precursor [Larimichthys crocea]|uniref:CD276 antigen-like protein n=1 Tax=Larimichthys crocea TaxID=215358 RepID=A0A6G0HJX1_LARCR|nr:CD276 antigen-like protein Precursor [Larimichthys crocea]